MEFSRTFGEELLTPSRSWAGGRRHARFELFEPISLCTQYSKMTGRLVNLSISGAALDVTNGLVPGLGDQVAANLRDSKHILGEVCRIAGGVVAIQFPCLVHELDELLWIEQRGWSVYTNRAFVVLQK